MAENSNRNCIINCKGAEIRWKIEPVFKIGSKYYFCKVKNALDGKQVSCRIEIRMKDVKTNENKRKKL